MTKHKPFYFSPKALSIPQLPPQLRKLAHDLAKPAKSTTPAAPMVVAFASELIQKSPLLPEWAAGSSSRYLIVSDVPDPVLPRLFSTLDVRRPDQRLHLTGDAGAIRRLIVSSARQDPMLGIVDAWTWHGTLTLVTGDFQFRAFPIGRVPVIAQLRPEERDTFEISPDGSWLYWPCGDIHLGVSQILQDADPMYLADIAIERNRHDHTGEALRTLREERGLRQTDIPGLEQRQVRRIEGGISRLRVATAEKFAAAFGMTLTTLLDAIGRHAGEVQARKPPKSIGTTMRP